MDKLEGKIALITGGNSGIGLATVARFVNEGAYTFRQIQSERVQIAAGAHESGHRRAVVLSAPFSFPAATGETQGTNRANPHTTVVNKRTPWHG